VNVETTISGNNRHDQSTTAAIGIPCYNPHNLHGNKSTDDNNMEARNISVLLFVHR